MLIHLLQHIKPHPNLNTTLPSWRSQHPKARLKLDPFINPPITHKRIPGLLGVFLSRFRIHVRYLAPRTAGDDVEVERGRRRGE